MKQWLSNKIKLYCSWKIKYDFIAALSKVLRPNEIFCFISVEETVLFAQLSQGRERCDRLMNQAIQAITDNLIICDIYSHY